MSKRRFKPETADSINKPLTSSASRLIQSIRFVPRRRWRIFNTGPLWRLLAAQTPSLPERENLIGEPYRLTSCGSGALELALFRLVTPEQRLCQVSSFSPQTTISK